MINGFSKSVSLLLFTATLCVYVQAEDKRNDLISITGSDNSNSNSNNRFGIHYNTEKLKVSADHASDFNGLNALFKFNPIDEKGYIKVGASYSNQKIYGDWLDSYSSFLGLGYMIQNDLYFELSGIESKFNGNSLIPDQRVHNLNAKLNKRFETSVGTIDAYLNSGRTYYDNVEDINYYIAGIGYYPQDNIFLGYQYDHTQNNIINYYSLAYGYFIASYDDYISQNSHTLTLGVQFAFTDLVDIKSYRMPTNIKLHLSE